MRAIQTADRVPPQYPVTLIHAKRSWIIIIVPIVRILSHLWSHSSTDLHVSSLESWTSLTQLAMLHGTAQLTSVSLSPWSYSAFWLEGGVSHTHSLRADASPTHFSVPRTRASTEWTACWDSQWMPRPFNMATSTWETLALIRIYLIQQSMICSMYHKRHYSCSAVTHQRIALEVKIS